MERKFLLYLLQATIIGIRKRSYEQKDKVTFELCDLLHNIPLQLTSEEDAKSAYEYLMNNVKELGREEWINIRMNEFNSMFPEYKNSN